MVLSLLVRSIVVDEFLREETDSRIKIQGFAVDTVFTVFICRDKYGDTLYDGIQLRLRITSNW